MKYQLPSLNTLYLIFVSVTMPFSEINITNITKRQLNILLNTLDKNEKDFIIHLRIMYIDRF